MNTNDYSNLQNKKSSADSGLYGNGSAYRTVPAAGGNAYSAGSYPQRNLQADSYRASAQARPAYDAASYGAPRQNASAPASGGTHARTQQPPQDSRAYAQGGHSHRINHNPTAQQAGAAKPASNGNGNGNGGNGNGNGGRGTGNRNGNGKKKKKKPIKKKTLKQRFLA